MSASVSGDPSLFLKLPRAELTVSAGLCFTATRNSFDQAESQTAMHTAHRLFGQLAHTLLLIFGAQRKHYGA